MDMDIAYDLAKYLDDSNFGTLGTDIFVEQIPAELNGLYVMRVGGQLNSYLPIEETAVDIYVKHTSSQTAIQLLERIKRHIHRMHNTVTLNGYIYSILVIGNVEAVDRDLEYSKIYKITLSVLYRDTDLIS